MSISNHPGKLFAFSLSALICSGIVPSACAQHEHVDLQSDVRIGVGLMGASTAWTGNNTDVSLVPFFDASIGNWHFNGDNPIGYQVELSESWSISAGIGMRNDGYDSNPFTLSKLSGHQVFDDYDKPDTEVIANYGVTWGWLAFDASRDISNSSESNTVSLSAEFPVYQSATGFRLSTRVSMDWYDSNYVNYYYGVANEQANDSVGRVAYQSSAALNYEWGINATYRLSERWMMMGSISRTKLDNNIFSSPLIDSDFRDSAVLLLMFQL